MDVKKTVFLTSFHGIISKNILNTDALKELATRTDSQIIVFVPQHKRDFFQSYFAYKNVLFEGVDVEKIIETNSNSYAYIFAQLLIDSYYLWYKKRERLDKNHSVKNWIKYFLERFFTKIFAGHRYIHRLFRFVDGVSADTSFLSPYFQKYNPVGLYATDIFDKADVAFLREAQRRGLKTVGMVRSWDNCYSKGLLRVVPEKAIVNNELIRDELATMHDVEVSCITVCGFPQFDNFLHVPEMPRDMFFDKNGLDPKKRIILFSPVGFPLSDTDWQILQIFKDAIETKKIPHDVQVMVRLHPGRELPLGSFVPDSRFIFDKPGVYEGKDVEFSPQDITHLKDTLYYVDVVVWIATTLGFDAAVFNKPQIVVDFDGFKNMPMNKSIRRYHLEDHMKKFLDIGGVTKVNSPDELIVWTNRYLGNPTINQEKRDEMLQKEFFKIDGNAGRRIASVVAGHLLS